MTNSPRMEGGRPDAGGNQILSSSVGGELRPQSEMADSASAPGAVAAEAKMQKEKDEGGEEEHYTEFSRHHTGSEDDYSGGNSGGSKTPSEVQRAAEEAEEEEIRRHRADEAEQSVAYAGALVGENVLTPPPPSLGSPMKGNSLMSGTVGREGGVSSHRYSEREMERIVSEMEGMNREVARAERRGMAPRSASGRTNSGGGSNKGGGKGKGGGGGGGGGGRGTSSGGGGAGSAARGYRMDRTGGRSGDFDRDHDEDEDSEDYGEYENYEYQDDGPGLIGAAAGAAGAAAGAARNWWIRRRENRRQAELARQVELQRRKLQLEARMRDRARMTQRSDNALVHDTGGSALEAKLQAVTGRGRMDRRVAGEAAWGGGGVIAGICGVGSGEEYDKYGRGVSGSASHDTDDSFYASDDDENDDDRGGGNRKMKISRPSQTLSGDGMAVNVDFGEEEDDENYVKVNVVPEQPNGPDDEVIPFVLTEHQMGQIAARVLPPAIVLCRWKRLYSLARDGDSFDAFLRLVAGAQRSLLVIRTTKDEVFGAYSDSPYEAKHHAASASSYYGSAQACLWRILPSGDVKPYKWTGMNRYIQLVDVRSKMIAFGGGGNAGEFGLCVEDDFRRGSTGRCGTFGNDPLCDSSDGGSFEVVDVECWAFLSGFG